MKFETPEANGFFSLAIIVEKNITSAAKEYEKGNITNEDMVNFRKSIFEVIEKTEKFLSLQSSKFIEEKSKQRLSHDGQQ